MINKDNNNDDKIIEIISLLVMVVFVGFIIITICNTMIEIKCIENKGNYDYGKCIL